MSCHIMTESLPANALLYALERNALLLAETKQQTSDYIRSHHNIC